MGLSDFRHGERVVVTAGGLLLVNLFFFPWHRVANSGATRTAIQDPNALQGTIAFLLAVAMVAQVILARSNPAKANPTLVKLQSVAGMAAFAMLAWKLALEPTLLSVGAFLGLVLAGVLAYGGMAMSRGWNTPPWK